MAELTLDVAGRSYRLACENGEEEHLTALAARIDAEARKLARTMGQMPEGRLMLMAALMVADRLHDAEKNLVALERKLAETRKLAEMNGSGEGAISREEEAKLTAELASLAERIESLTEQVNPSPGLPFEREGH